MKICNLYYFNGVDRTDGCRLLCQVGVQIGLAHHRRQSATVQVKYVGAHVLAHPATDTIFIDNNFHFDLRKIYFCFIMPNLIQYKTCHLITAKIHPILQKK